MIKPQPEKNSRRTLPPAGQKALVVLLGLFFALLSMEAALRLGGFIYGASQERRNRLAIGRGGYRIMCLGESTTAGGEDMWPSLLEKIFVRRYPAARFSVINKGVPGFNTSEIMQELEGNLDEVRPDLVIAMMGMNDDSVRYYEGIAGADSPLFRHLRLYKLFRILCNKDKAVRPRPMPPGSGPDSPATGPEDPYMHFQDRTLNIALYEESLRKKIERDPEDVTSLYVLGKYWTTGAEFQHHDRGLMKKGEELLLRAARLAPKNSFVFATLGMHYLLDGNDPGRGLSLLEKAARLNPTGENWQILGLAYKDHGMADKAEAALLKAIVPGSPLAMQQVAVFELSWLYIKRKKFSKAEELLQQALTRDPHSVKITRVLAGLYEESGRPDLARKYAAELSAAGGMFTYRTRVNFGELRRILGERGMRLAVMQYPMCGLEPLKELFDDPADIIFIDNERAFKKAVKEKGYAYYFKDMFAGNFGHCTRAGNELIARNAADALSGEIGSIQGQ